MMNTEMYSICYSGRGKIHSIYKIIREATQSEMHEELSRGGNPELYSNNCYIGRVIESILPHMIGKECVCPQYIQTAQEIERIKSKKKFNGTVYKLETANL